MNIVLQRLHQQQISTHRLTRPEEVVAWMGAMQAQDFTGAKWAIGLRLPGSTEAEVTQAIDDGKIIRTWPMRGTLHFVAAEDVHWMRALLTPRILARSERRHLELELDAAMLLRCEKLFIKALRGGRRLTRDAMMELLGAAGIPTDESRRYHILWRLAQEGLLCFGPHEGRQATFVLLDEWGPSVKPRDRDEALAELARRYFTSHGPATLRDFIWWSGLKVAEAKEALAFAAAALEKERIGDAEYWMARGLPPAPMRSPAAHLLPGFDEYMLGYTDRSAALSPRYAQRICPGSNGMFLSTVVVDGRVAGTWKRTIRKKAVDLEVTPFTSFKLKEKRAIAQALCGYGAYLKTESGSCSFVKTS